MTFIKTKGGGLQETGFKEISLEFNRDNLMQLVYKLIDNTYTKTFYRISITRQINTRYAVDAFYENIDTYGDGFKHYFHHHDKYRDNSDHHQLPDPRTYHKHADLTTHHTQEIQLAKDPAGL